MIWNKFDEGTSVLTHVHIFLCCIFKLMCNSFLYIFYIIYIFQTELDDIEADRFLLNEAENLKLRDVKKVIIGRVIADLDQFNWIKKTLPTHIPHRQKDYPDGNVK